MISIRIGLPVSGRAHERQTSDIWRQASGVWLLFFPVQLQQFVGRISDDGSPIEINRFNELIHHRYHHFVARAGLDSEIADVARAAINAGDGADLCPAAVENATAVQIEFEVLIGLEFDRFAGRHMNK